MTSVGIVSLAIFAPLNTYTVSKPLERKAVTSVVTTFSPAVILRKSMWPFQLNVISFFVTFSFFFQVTQTPLIRSLVNTFPIYLEQR